MSEIKHFDLVKAVLAGKTLERKNQRYSSLGPDYLEGQAALEALVQDPDDYYAWRVKPDEIHIYQACYFTPTREGGIQHSCRDSVSDLGSALILLDHVDPSRRPHVVHVQINPDTLEVIKSETIFPEKQEPETEAES